MKHGTRAKVATCVVVVVFAAALVAVLMFAHAYYEKQREILRRAYTMSPSEWTEEEAQHAEDMQTVFMLKILTNPKDVRSIVHQANLLFNVMGAMYSSNPEVQAKREEFKIAFKVFEAAVERVKRAVDAFQALASSNDAKLKDAARKEMYAARESLFQAFETLEERLEELRTVYDALPPPVYPSVSF
ncbi:MAG: hypothetical protein Q7S28_01900 [bacterium]|nr:hypothetical protein [bacterium]